MMSLRKSDIKQMIYYVEKKHCDVWQIKISFGICEPEEIAPMADQMFYFWQKIYGKQNRNLNNFFSGIIWENLFLVENERCEPMIILTCFAIEKLKKNEIETLIIYKTVNIHNTRFYCNFKEAFDRISVTKIEPGKIQGTIESLRRPPVIEKGVASPETVEIVRNVIAGKRRFASRCGELNESKLKLIVLLETEKDLY